MVSHNFQSFYAFFSPWKDGEVKMGIISLTSRRSWNKKKKKKSKFCETK